jgi:HAD superfamily hydrolase (TIGR01509 family)
MQIKEDSLQSLSNFEAIFFDMDGLFLDSEPQWHECETEMMHDLGYAWQDSDQLHCLGGPLTRVADYMSQCLQGRHTSEYLLDRIITEMTHRLSERPPFMPGAKEFSQVLKNSGVRHALVSASPRVIVDAVISGFPDHHFEFTVAQGDIERTKPFPDPYLHAAKLAGVNIENCLIFEDSFTGITAAKASGAFVVAIPHYITVEPELRLRVEKSLGDLTIAKLESYYLENLVALSRP